MGERESVKDQVISLHARIRREKTAYHKAAKTLKYIQEKIYERFSTEIFEYIELIGYLKHNYKIKNNLTEATWEDLKQDSKIAEYDTLLDMMWENIPDCGKFAISTHDYESRIKSYGKEESNIHSEEVC